MKGTNRALLIGAMAALAAVGSPAPINARVRQDPPPISMRTGNRLLDLITGAGMGGHSPSPRYIKRPFHTTAEMKRKAIKAKNRRRHKLAMKRKH